MALGRSLTQSPGLQLTVPLHFFVNERPRELERYGTRTPRLKLFALLLPALAWTIASN
jgi:hypothetical protein